MAKGQRIRIGNQTAFSAGRVTLPFEFAVDHGFDAFEWFPDKKAWGEGWTAHDIPPEVRSWIKETAAANDIRLSVHAPSLWNPFSPEAEASFRETIDFAREIGAALFTIHLQTDRGIGAYVDAVRPFMRMLDRANIALAVENTVYTSPQDFTDLFGYLAKSGGGTAHSAGMCLDLGHANLFRETRNDYLSFIDMLAPEVPIVHVHLHENYGDQDNHLTIFTGPAGKDASGVRGFVERLKTRNFSGCMILEQWPSPGDLLVEARNRLIGMIGNGPDLPQALGSDSGDENIVTRFEQGNRRFLSWRKRLDWILHLMSDTAERPGLDLLTYIAVYLRFLGTGEVRCGEDGGHYRPSHHAKISEHLYKKLVTLAADDNLFVLRKIYPWLPSFDGEFKKAEPLTIIRDIAHRNDIPRELKQEIKKTLQNKLHRSAGPEDLAVSNALLQRITSPGVSYPDVFVSEFRRFHEELKDFFNAGSLKELLIRIIEKNEFGDASLLREFLVMLDQPEKDCDALKALERLTTIRTLLGPKIAGDVTAAGLRLQIADIRLEDHSFVLLSRMVNDIEDRLAREKMPWVGALRASLLAVANIRLGGFDPEECAAIEAELGLVSSMFDPGRRDDLLRLKATADRCLRLAESYRDKVLTLFPEKAATLGQALGVREDAIKVYAESDIRSHPVFQLSKLVSLLLKEIRERASLPFWDVIVPGTARGSLLAAVSLSSLPVTRDGPAIALVDHAEGEEEIPHYVTGIVATAETPLLSHLAVRARQSSTVFIFCGEVKRIEEMRAFSGKPMSIAAAGGDFQISYAEFGGDVEPGRPCIKATPVPEAHIEKPEQGVVAIDAITLSTGGGKAYGARKLGDIAIKDSAGFMVPEGLVVPFGAMEESLRSMPALAEEYVSRTEKIDGLPAPRQDVCLARLREIVMQLKPHDKVLSGVAAHFGKDDRLMVRSSSNWEDAEDLAGAGIYDSVSNVALSETASAICRVWSSLWSRRARDARKKAGIPHEACRMAVLIQSMMPADVSFVMHTVNPATGNEEEVLIELAVGLGETLASGREPGSPYRIVYHKKTGDIEMISFASYSFASRAADHGGTVRKRIDYSEILFCHDDDFRKRVARRIGEVGRLVESSFGKPQDIEGLVRGEDIYLVQARPQVMLQDEGRKRCPN